MKANELRIGNWVKHPASVWSYRTDTHGYGYIEFQWEDTDWYKAGECCISIEDVEPIPLTEEWLVRFGFVRQGGRKMWVKDKLCVEFKELPNLRGDFIEGWYIGLKDLGNVLFYSFMKLEYVHQLQNLYHALTGEELELKP